MTKQILRLYEEIDLKEIRMIPKQHGGRCFGMLKNNYHIRKIIGMSNKNIISLE